MAGCNSITLSALDASCSNSVGGIQVVYLIPYDYISGATVDTETGDTQGMITGITYASSAYTDASWVQYKFRKNTGSMTSNLNLDETNGVSYIETDLTMMFSKMETRKRTEMVALAKGEVACVVKDSNGLYWFLGYNEGVTTNSGLGQTGQQKTDGNYYQVVLRDSSEEYPFEITKSLGDQIAAAAQKDAS
jgi:hypothetical protein